MKKFLLSITVLLGVPAIMFAQSSFQFHNSSNVDISQTTLTLNGIDSDYELDTYIQVKNNSGSAKNIKIKRYEITAVPSSVNYFCWTVCYAPMTAGVKPLFPLTTDMAYNDYVTANANSYAPNQLIAYHKPNGTVGTSTYRFVAFDGANPNDSTWMDVQVDIVLSVDEKSNLTQFNTWPNPASSITNVKYQFQNSSNDQQLVVTDMIGARKAAYNLVGNEGTLKVDLNDFATGVYFFTILSNGTSLSTKKIVVTR